MSRAIYAAFVAIALYLNWHPALFDFGGRLGALKALVWIAYFAFLGYSIYCSVNENIFRTFRAIAQFHWGRQIGIDLYLGLFVGLILIYLNEGIVAVALWLIPILLFANMAVLLYVGIHFEAIVTAFLG